MPFCGASLTGELIAENIYTAFVEWEISGKVKVIISDSAANMKSAIAQLPSVSHSPCVQHRLQLVVEEGCLNQRCVPKIVASIKRIVSHFPMPVTSTKLLREAQVKYGLPQHALIKEEATK
ncbi:hypothetical protein PR048_010510 [Dryococelus australis]|uniref:Transposase n=1 Tax=Dryococelus australis TaxID=614101 RepID=A0ABQ9I2Y7_9NEOP|nr:hypothetical protein PR048_010510 [Dryococelus australis]